MIDIDDHWGRTKIGTIRALIAAADPINVWYVEDTNKNEFNNKIKIVTWSSVGDLRGGCDVLMAATFSEDDFDDDIGCISLVVLARMLCILDFPIQIET